MEGKPNQQNRGAGEDPIEERLIDQGQTDRADVIDAAAEAFEQDQRDADHPSRIDRSHGVEDPSHSRGSVRHGPGERDFNENAK
jgi:hypothetical protein